MIYYKDAARAAYALLQAPRDSIQMVNYNVGGIRRVTPREIEAALKERVDDVVINYATPSGPPMGAREIAWDDSYARREWGWLPEYAGIGRVVEDFIQEMRKSPR